MRERARAKKVDEGRLRDLEKLEVQVRDLQARRAEVKIPDHSAELLRIRRVPTGAHWCP